jgi:hypothetical protein
MSLQLGDFFISPDPIVLTSIGFPSSLSSFVMITLGQIICFVLVQLTYTMAGLVHKLWAGRRLGDDYSPDKIGTWRQVPISTSPVHKKKSSVPCRSIILRLSPQHRQSKYNADTAVEYTVTHSLSNDVIGIDNSSTCSDESYVMSTQWIFNISGHPSPTASRLLVPFIEFEHGRCGKNSYIE